MIKTFLKITLILLLFIFCSCSPNNESIVKNYIIDHNLHNVEKSLSYYSDDITFELVGTWIKSGKKEIKSLEEWDSAVNSNLKLNLFKTSGDTLLYTVKEKNDWFSAIGIEQINYDSVLFIIENGKINKIIAIPLPEINIKIGKAMNSIMNWAAQTKTSLTDLIPNGKFIYSKESAKKWLSLLKRWQGDKPLQSDK